MRLVSVVFGLLQHLVPVTTGGNPSRSKIETPFSDTSLCFTDRCGLFCCFRLIATLGTSHDRWKSVALQIEAPFSDTSLSENGRPFPDTTLSENGRPFPGGGSPENDIRNYRQETLPVSGPQRLIIGVAVRKRSFSGFQKLSMRDGLSNEYAWLQEDRRGASVSYLHRALLYSGTAAVRTP